MPVQADRPFASRRRFPAAFWSAVALELVQRTTWGGVNSALAVCLAAETVEDGAGAAANASGSLPGALYAVTCALPVLGGALADRYGFRRTLLVALSLIAAGSAVAACAPSRAQATAALGLIAAGAGLFRPIAGGTVARTTDRSNAAQGFGIYCWTVNLGALAALALAGAAGRCPWRWVLAASGACTGLLLLPALACYRDPQGSRRRQPPGATLLDAVAVLGDERVMLPVLVYSVFWVLYFQAFGTVLFYLRDFAGATGPGALRAAGLPAGLAFDARHVMMLNAGTVVALQGIVSRVVGNRPALPTMAIGMGIGATGFVCLALSCRPWLAAAGIVAFAVGEMTAQPTFYGHVALTAPVDRKAAYMGGALLCGGLGSLIGPGFGSALYARLVTPALGTAAAMARARALWLVFAGLGLAAACALVLCGRYALGGTPAVRRRARRLMCAANLLVLTAGIADFQAAVGSAPASLHAAAPALVMAALGAAGFAMTLVRGTATGAVAGAAMSGTGDTRPGELNTGITERASQHPREGRRSQGQRPLSPSRPQPQPGRPTGRGGG